MKNNNTDYSMPYRTFSLDKITAPYTKDSKSKNKPKDTAKDLRVKSGK